eukprot:jgi/Psemu1/38493/gm1.38493_g
MHKYTSEEYAQLPHVVMTSDKHWDSSILDGVFTPHDVIFLQKYLHTPHQLPYEDYNEFGVHRGNAPEPASHVTSFASHSSHIPILQPLDNLDTSFWLSPTADFIHQEILARSCSVRSPSDLLTATMPHVQSPTDMDSIVVDIKEILDTTDQHLNRPAAIIPIVNLLCLWTKSARHPLAEGN